MLGKYSPTVRAAYDANQDWHDKYAGGDGYGPNEYDPEGYDRYGYDKNNVDRAGILEDIYSVCEYGGNSGEDLYFKVQSKWGFDGVKPVWRENDQED